MKNTESIASSFDRIHADYDAAKQSRLRKNLTGVSSMGSGADYHYRSDHEFLKLIEWARSFDRNDCVVGQAITRLIDNVLQQGILPDSQSGNPEYDKRITAKWQEWSETPDLCDLEEEKTLHEQAKLALRSVLVDGDVFHALLKTGSVQHFEAHRVRTPTNTKRNVVHGVLMDDMRRRKEIWITKENISPHQNLSRVSEIVPYAVKDDRGFRNILHQYLPKRYSQSRGVSALAPVMDFASIHNDLQFVQLVKAQVAACVTFFREIDAQSGIKAAALQGGARKNITQDDGSIRVIEEIAPGMEIMGRPGEKLSGFSPNIPNPEFFDHALLVLTIIAINLNMPVHILLLDPSRTNFSGWRGAIDQARMSWRELQKFMITSFYNPVMKWKTRQWLATDAALAAAANMPETNPYGVVWNPPFWPYIDPSKDAKADATIINERLGSRRQQLARRGLDIDRVDGEEVEDRKKLIVLCHEAAQELNAELGLNLTWVDIAREKVMTGGLNERTGTDSPVV